MPRYEYSYNLATLQPILYGGGAGGSELYGAWPLALATP